LTLDGPCCVDRSGVPEVLRFVVPVTDEHRLVGAWWPELTQSLPDRIEAEVAMWRSLVGPDAPFSETHWYDLVTRSLARTDDLDALRRRSSGPLAGVRTDPRESATVRLMTLQADNPPAPDRE
jgi:hypothetical protein